MEATETEDVLTLLGDVLEDDLVVVDVGARWGVAPVWDRLGSHCLAIGFEPDLEECERLIALNRSNPRRRFVPVGLGAQTGMATLYLTKNHQGCSLYPPSRHAVAHHPGLVDGALDATTIIEVMALDEWCASEGIARVDAIKLDTQGSELDVLRGGEETLRSIRLVDVEVQFNELYEGIPLFADVDQYLRQQGFVLWKLRDFAHYGQYNVRKDWRTINGAYYDDVVAAFPSGAGQLFWANAIYVKQDVAYPEAALGWRQLVRDACITGAHHLNDLCCLAVELAKQTAPPSVARDLATITDAQDRALSMERRVIQHSTVLHGTLKVCATDPDFTGGGWYPPHLHNYGGVRWSGPGRDAWIDVPVALRPGTRVEVLLVGFITPAVAAGLTFELNRTPVMLQPSPHELGTLFVGEVPPGYDSTKAFTRIMLHTGPPAPLCEVDPASSDDTELGAAFFWLRLISPEAL